MLWLESCRNSEGGGGVSQNSKTERKCEAKLKFPEGGEGLNPRKTFHGRGMDIFLENTILVNSRQAWLIQRNAMTHPPQYQSHYKLSFFFVPVKCPYNSLQENAYNMAYDHIISSYLSDPTGLSRGQI